MLSGRLLWCEHGRIHYGSISPHPIPKGGHWERPCQSTLYQAFGPSPIRQWDAKCSGWQPAVSKDVNQDAWQSVRGAQSGGARHRSPILVWVELRFRKKTSPFLRFRLAIHPSLREDNWPCGRVLKRHTKNSHLPALFADKTSQPIHGL